MMLSPISPTLTPKPKVQFGLNTKPLEDLVRSTVHIEHLLTPTLDGFATSEAHRVEEALQKAGWKLNHPRRIALSTGSWIKTNQGLVVLTCAHADNPMLLFPGRLKVTEGLQVQFVPSLHAYQNPFKGSLQFNAPIEPPDWVLELARSEHGNGTVYSSSWDLTVLKPQNPFAKPIPEPIPLATRRPNTGVHVDQIGKAGNVKSGEFTFTLDRDRSYSSIVSEEGDSGGPMIVDGKLAGIVQEGLKGFKEPIINYPDATWGSMVNNIRRLLEAHELIPKQSG